MRPAIISGCSAAALAIGGWAVPIVFPHVDPQLAQWMLWVAAGLLSVAVMLWAWDLKKPGEVGTAVTQATGGPQSPAIGSIGGDAHFHFGGGAAPNEGVLPPRGPIVRQLSRAEEDVARARAAKSPYPGLAILTSGPTPGTEMRCPEMPVWQALRHIAEVIGDRDEHECYPEARRQFRQAAATGQIDVWGRKGIAPTHMDAPKSCSEIWTIIDPDHWQDYKLNSMATGEMWDGYDHTNAEPHVSHGIQAGQYWSLRVHEYQIKREWRKPKPPSGEGPPPPPTTRTAWNK